MLGQGPSGLAGSLSTTVDAHVPTVTLVCDNRDNVNWGCRSTSWALDDMLQSRSTVVDRLIRADITRPEPIRPRWWTSQGPAAEVARRALFHRATPAMFGRRALRVNAALGYHRDYRDPDFAWAASEVVRRRRDVAHFDRLCTAVESAEMVVINGEGSAILRDPPRRDMLAQFVVIALARHFGRRVAYVNAMVSDSPDKPRSAGTAQAVAEALGACDLVALRDPRSQVVLRAIAPRVESVVVPDALFTWASMLGTPEALRPERGAAMSPFPERHLGLDRVLREGSYIAVSGSSHASLDKPRAAHSYSAIVERLRVLGRPIVLVETCSGDDYLTEVGRKVGVPVIPVTVPILQGASLLGSAAVFVSGRYHPSILAACAGTPLVSLRGNSHKVEALRELLGEGDAPVLSEAPTGRELDQLVDLVESAMGDTSSRQARRTAALQLGEQSAAILDHLGLAPGARS